MTLLCAVCLERAHNAEARDPLKVLEPLTSADIPEAITIGYGGDALCLACLDEIREFSRNRADEGARFLGRPAIQIELYEDDAAPALGVYPLCTCGCRHDHHDHNPRSMKCHDCRKCSGYEPAESD